MLLEILILLLAIPIGFLIASLARDELVSGRKWFRVLIIVSIITSIWFWLTGMPYISWTSGFILILSIVALVKSDGKKWVKNRRLI